MIASRASRMLFIFFLAGVIGSVTAGEESRPGDFGYKHTEKQHRAYQNFFNQGRCHCHTGQCRVTVFRYNKESPSGVDMVISRQWYHVPEKALRREAIPAELREDEAHICANPSLIPGQDPNIECAILNDMG